MRKYFRFFFLILLNFSSLLYSNPKFESHLKTLSQKPAHHRMPGIDFIYMINLDERPEKWMRSSELLHQHGIFPYRFSAVNGWNLSVETINEIGLRYAPGMKGGYMGTSYLPGYDLKPIHRPIDEYGEVYFCHCMARGTIGIVLSHLSILHDALKSGYQTIWVLEDDIEIVSDPTKLTELIEELDATVGKKNWDILFTDRNTRNVHGVEVPASGMAPRPNFNPQNLKPYMIRKAVGKNFIRIGARFGAYSMIIRRSGIKKIYNFITSKSIFHPYDMDFHLPPGIKLYTVRKNIVSNLPTATSDNGRPAYKLRQKNESK